MKRKRCSLTVLAAAALWFSVTVARAENMVLPQAEEASLSQQLLQSYFDTAGVCTTSEIDKLHDNGDVVTVEITIEPDTRSGLAQVLEHERDNWFSLHCPPEIHGVWRQAQPPRDILISGLISDDEPYTLSCVDYQSANQWGVRRVTIREKIQNWLQDKLQMQ
ncbi:hypothetical protein ACUNV4_08385 [Granulosicoccus sp. 3-233]|uniref:hypothetical protein n=1 Tax=Granulosicoccus sp. 3-233 TaxID=3417969 RepID=UPI003D35337F